MRQIFFIVVKILYTFFRRVEIQDRTLIFHKIEIEDAGEYECFARNRVANASAIAEVRVSGKY